MTDHKNGGIDPTQAILAEIRELKRGNQEATRWFDKVIADAATAGITPREQLIRDGYLQPKTD